MKDYLYSAVLGVFVGILYGLFNVRSPAPPVIALLGLLGMLAGEQIPHLVKRLWAPVQTSGLEQQIDPNSAKVSAAVARDGGKSGKENIHG